MLDFTTTPRNFHWLVFVPEICPSLTSWSYFILIWPKSFCISATKKMIDDSVIISIVNITEYDFIINFDGTTLFDHSHLHDDVSHRNLSVFPLHFMMKISCLSDTFQRKNYLICKRKMNYQAEKWSKSLSNYDVWSLLNAAHGRNLSCHIEAY